MIRFALNLAAFLFIGWVVLSFVVPLVTVGGTAYYIWHQVQANPRPMSARESACQNYHYAYMPGMNGMRYRISNAGNIQCQVEVMTDNGWR
jgi:hypothetical protein